MKKFLVFVLLIFGGLYWLHNWVVSGEMDQFIQQQEEHRDMSKVLYFIGDFYYTFKQRKTASYYLAWVKEKYPDLKEIPRVYWHLGQCYEEMDRKDLALEQYTILKDSFTATEYGRMGERRYSHLKYN